MISVNDFLTMPARLRGEREERVAQASRALQFHNRFLDDCLRVILPHDLVLLGAPSGMGKTDLALAIAMNNAMNDRRVAYFALEAEPLELERRVKFGWISSEAYKRNLPGKDTVNYTDWYLGRCEDVIGGLNDECDRWFLNHLGGLRTFYRGQRFDKGQLRKSIEAVHEQVELIVIDHLHYVDSDEDEKNEHSAIGETTKVIRDMSLVIGKPILLVAHLRKRDPRLRALVPTIDDFHGSSNITKIATQVITIGPATAAIKASKWYFAPTFVSVLKDRRAGAPPFVALVDFDKRTRRYADDYTLGRVIKGGTEWEEIKPTDRPGWASGFKQLEMNV